MVLCIIPPNFRLIAEILKEFERERRSGRTDGPPAGRSGAMTDGNTRWADGGQG